MSEVVFLLAPSRGLGGGIERYVSTIETAFLQNGVRYIRFDLRQPDSPSGMRAKFRFIREVMRAVRSSDGPVRMVLAHRNLLPIVAVAAKTSQFSGATVIMHGCEIWSRKLLRSGRMLRRKDVRVVAVSNFSAGALAGVCRAAVLHPGLSPEWYETLVAAASVRPGSGDEISLVTAFRLADWRNKGLSEVLEALSGLADSRVRLTVCGTGPVPDDLASEVARHPWCRIAANLDDQQLAEQFASADLFVLATRMRGGTSGYGEGFGLVLLEAQITGTPVVAPAHGGSGDAYQPGITGLAPLDESPQALRAVLAQLLNDPHRRAEMGRAAAAWSQAQFEPVAYGRRAVRTLVEEPSCAAYAG